jgi:putative SOS response-associated peptidase YedK
MSAADGGVLSFAGLRDRWKNPDTGEFLTSCTIIVTDANALTGTIHNRMLVVLDKDVGPWLDGTAGAALLRPAAETAFACGRCRGGSTREAPAMTIRL